MSNLQNEKFRKLLKPASMLKSSHSAKEISKKANSISISNNDSKNFTQSILSKSVCRVLQKNLDDLTVNLEHLRKKSRIYDNELCSLVLSCESSLKIAKQKLSELSLDDEFFKLSDSKISQETSTVLKSDSNEYILFLEYLIVYEQTKTEVILKKSKFPKSRIQEVEKSIFEEFSLKNPGFYKTAGNAESWCLKKSQRELNDLANKLKNRMVNSVKILPELESLLYEDEIHIEASLNEPKLQPKSQIETSKTQSKETKKMQDLYENSVADNKKLSAKYNYLISKLNKQDATLKIQAKILANISKDSKDLKESFEEFVNEMKFYLSMLNDHLSRNPTKKITVTSHLKEKAAWESDKEKLKKELESCKKDKSELENKLKNALNELIQLKDQQELSEDSLDLEMKNVKHIIEIQKLKEQINLLNFKSSNMYADHKEEINLLKGNITHLKAEKFSCEERIKGLSSCVFELKQENEKLLEEITKNKTSQAAFEHFKPIPMLCGDTLNVCEPSESSGKVNPVDILAMVTDEVEDIIESIKSHNIFKDFHSNGVLLLKKVAEFVIDLKENLCEESGYFVQVVDDLVQDYKTRVNSGDKAFELDQRVDTESFMQNKQIEIYKTKLKDKKNQLELCHKQISYLKKSLKESKEEASNSNPIDLECIKGMFANILKEISQLSQKTETLIEVMMKTLGFSQEEIMKINSERKLKKNSFFSRVPN